VTIPSAWRQKCHPLRVSGESADELSMGRRRSRAVVLAVLFAFGSLTVAITTIRHFSYPKTYAVTLTLDPQCSSNGEVYVGGHDWIGAGTRSIWPTTVAGVFEIVSPHMAVFTAAGAGGHESFTLLPKGDFWQLDCPLVVGRR
jgi:hypothetical protein